MHPVFRLALGSLFLFPLTATAYDIEHGADVYEASQCVSCHASGFEGGKAQDFNAVRQWVGRCNGNFGYFFPEDEPDVAAYLSREYYGYSIPTEGSEGS
jgi:mono/diheme cytochrome c family protein